MEESKNTIFRFNKDHPPGPGGPCKNWYEDHKAACGGIYEMHGRPVYINPKKRGLPPELKEEMTQVKAKRK